MIPLAEFSQARTLRLRFITDSYTRAMQPSMPMWKWALWRQPQLIREEGEVIYDFAGRLKDARAFVRLDSDGKDRPFDKPGEDSSGATFAMATENLPKLGHGTPVIIAFTPYKDGKRGLTVAEYQVK